MTDKTDAVWPYPTLDDVSHLACEEVPLLRARIDQLLEERREWRLASGLAVDVHVPRQWGLTPGEERLLAELVRMPEGAVATKERLHIAFSGGDEPDTALKIVDVIVCKVRKKLGEHGVCHDEDDGPIRTVWGRGYALSPTLRRLLRC